MASNPSTVYSLMARLSRSDVDATFGELKIVALNFLRMSSNGCLTVVSFALTFST